MNKILKQSNNMIEFIAGLREYPEEVICEPIKEGKWSILQIIGHLYYWDKYNVENMLPNMDNGADLPKFPDHDLHNEEAMSFVKEFPIESLFDNFILTRKELNEEILRIGNEVRFTIGGGKRKFSAESFLKIFVKHDEHHVKQMKEKLNR